MNLGWKVLIPVSLAWILMVATVRVALQHGTSTPVYIIGGAIVALLLVLAWTADVAAERRRAAAGEPASAGDGGTGAGAAGPAGTAGPAEAGDTTAGAGFPVPPLDLPHYHGVGVVVPAGDFPADHSAAPDGTVKEVTGA
jgi:NADH-quinone oxidoreductase subunit H